MNHQQGVVVSGSTGTAPGPHAQQQMIFLPQQTLQQHNVQMAAVSASGAPNPQVQSFVASGQRGPPSGIPHNVHHRHPGPQTMAVLQPNTGTGPTGVAPQPVMMFPQQYPQGMINHQYIPQQHPGGSGPTISVNASHVHQIQVSIHESFELMMTHWFIKFQIMLFPLKVTCQSVLYPGLLSITCQRQGIEDALLFLTSF